MIDSIGVLNRSNNTKPFLLLDGHSSRFREPFVQYVKTSNTPWTVCVGVSYATHIWQVHDSNELNGAFKVKIQDAKLEYINKRGEYKFRTISDVVPLVKICFESTFSNIENAKKATIE